MRSRPARSAVLAALFVLWPSSMCLPEPDVRPDNPPAVDAKRAETGSGPAEGTGKPDETASEAKSRPKEDMSPAATGAGDKDALQQSEATPEPDDGSKPEAAAAGAADNGAGRKSEAKSEPEDGVIAETAAAAGDKPAPSAGEAAPENDKPASLTVASWGGAYSESQQRAYFAPFKDETGIAIEMVSHNGRFAALAAEDRSKPPEWDIVDIDPAALETGCRNGKLEKVEPAALTAAKNGTPASDDFFPGVLHECGVPSVAWSSAIVFDKRAFKKAEPRTAKDFFDVKKFPGGRALRRDPKYAFELAVMADGVAPEEVYETLATDEGVSRALKQFDAIRDHIVWWERASEPIKQLAGGDAAMALAFNGRIFSAIVAENKPFGIIWDGQIFDLDFWAIPKGSPHKKAALDFIAFATRPDRLALQANWFPYGPVRKSALEQVGRHPEIDVDMTAYIPTSKENFKRALRLDAGWWKQHGEEMNRRFKVWTIGAGGSAATGDDAEKENAVR